MRPVTLRVTTSGRSQVTLALTLTLALVLAQARDVLRALAGHPAGAHGDYAAHGATGGRMEGVQVPDGGLLFRAHPRVHHVHHARLRLCAGAPRLASPSPVEVTSRTRGVSSGSRRGCYDML